MRQKIILAASVVIGLLAAFLAGSYISAREREVDALRAQLARRYRTVDVVVPAKSLPAGTRLESEDLRVRAVPENALSGQTIRATPNIALRLVGRTLALGVEAARPLQWSDIEGGAPDDRGLAGMLRPKMRALSISVSGAASVSNMVRPTDHVDVLGTFALPSKTVEGATELVTLTILQTFAEQMRGRLTLALRNPEDLHYETELPQVNFERIRASLEGLNERRQRDILRKRQ